MQVLKLIQPIKKFSNTIKIPGSKSYTNRSLIMAAIASGKTILRNISLGEDCIVLIETLKKLGVKIVIRKDKLKIMGGLKSVINLSGEVNAKSAGTTSRFLTSLLAFLPGVKVVLTGNERLNERPINYLVKALKKLGADIIYLGNKGYLPIRIKGISNEKIVGKRVKMKGDVSSQYFTSLMLIAPILKNGLEIEVIGDQVSKSYIDMTIEGMGDFGVKVINNKYHSYKIFPNQIYKSQDYKVEGDTSNASYFWGLAAVNGGSIRVKNINPYSVQGDIKFPQLLQRMGCKVSNGKDWIEVRGEKKLQGIEADMESMPDTAQTLAVVAAFAKGRTKITGLSTLKVKETDRLVALNNELRKMKIRSQVGKNFIIIYGGNPREALIKTYKDHRMAMSFAVAAGRVNGMKILDPDVVIKSFPNFWKMLNKLNLKSIKL